MDWIEAVLLGLLQGLTEFLPVSSSGHLALASILFGHEADQAPLTEIFLHLGTALSIMTVFRHDVVALARALRHLVAPRSWRARWGDDEAFRTVGLVALSAIPAGVIGVAFKDQLFALFRDARVVGVCLVATGVVLWLTRRVRGPGGEVGPGRAAGMGLAQAVAILPGISRSGATISTGLFLGGSREAVGRFAFLMALPPILGAAALGARDLGEGTAAPLLPTLTGALVAYVSGVFALHLLLRFVSRGRLHLFAPYCIVLGIVALFA